MPALKAGIFCAGMIVQGRIKNLTVKAFVQQIRLSK